MGKDTSEWTVAGSSSLLTASIFLSEIEAKNDIQEGCAIWNYHLRGWMSE